MSAQSLDMLVVGAHVKAMICQMLCVASKKNPRVCDNDMPLNVLIGCSFGPNAEVR